MNVSQWVNEKIGYRNGLLIEVKELQSSLDERERMKNIFIKVRDLFIGVGRITQERIKKYFEGIVTAMLKTIYGDEYSFKINFVEKRNSSECELKILKGDLEVDLKDEVGVGVVDIVSFAMRLAVWSLNNPRTEPIFVLDEPFKYVDTNRLELVGKALQELVKNLAVQIIMVSHDDELIEVADCAYRVSINNGISEVRRLV